jgi:hypothetical protein
LFTDGVCASIKAKAGASSGAVILTPMEKHDAAGKLGAVASSGLFKPAR